MSQFLEEIEDQKMNKVEVKNDAIDYMENERFSMFLAGDIGGTHTRLALFEEKRDLAMAAQEVFSSREHTGLLPMVHKFLQMHPTSIASASFGIAGPIRNGKCRTTNLPWVVDSIEISRSLELKSVYLINDLEANAWGIRVLKPEDLYLLHPGDSSQKGNIALIAAGTGLGEAGLFWDGNEHHPFASEGGHADFSPRDALEIEFLIYLNKIYPSHVSYERVVSGPGLKNIYEFLIQSRRETESAELKREIKNRDLAQLISEWGRQGRDLACTRALAWFLSLYGAEAGNLALKFLARGGVYVGGGIAPHLLDKLKEGKFMEGFLNKGRFRSLLETIPVRVILNDQTALLGAAEYARIKNRRGVSQ